MIDWRTFIRLWKMCDCGCDCDVLVCDFTLLFFRYFLEKILDKQPNLNRIFFIRCVVGLLFDAIEYAILTATADNIDYNRFQFIFFMYSVFIVMLGIFLLCKKEVYIFIFALFFKCISLSVAISIFTTTSHFEWETIETSFTTIDSAEDFFTAMLIFVSFVDICLNIAALIYKFLCFCVKMEKGKEKCCETFCGLMCKRVNRVGVID